MDLTKEYYYKNNTEITEKELVSLANELINTTWTISHWGNLKEINLKKKGWKFEFHNRKGSIGTCYCSRRVIAVSKAFLESNIDKAREFENTLRHEVAHALDNETRRYSNHDDVWKTIAQRVLANPKSTSSNFQLPTGKYIYTCPECGKTHPVHKKPRNIPACADCCNRYNGGKYSNKFQFILSEAPKATLSQSNIETPEKSDKPQSKGQSKYYADIVRLFDEGKSGYTIAKELGIYTSQVYPIIKKLSK